MLTSNEMQEEELSPWRLLPSDILERSLSLLPLPDVFRVRTVCKRWNTLIHCSQFQDCSFRSSIAWGPFYIPRVGWKGRGSNALPWSSYDLSEKKWITMPPLEFPSLPSGRCFGWNLMAADGGLLCFGASDGRGILVCNPMTGKWTELPEVCGGSRAPVVSHMIVDEDRSSYKILFAGKALLKLKFTTNMIDVYDSTTKTWSSIETQSPDTLFRSGAYNNGNFYTLTRHLRTGVHAVEALNLTTLRWIENATTLIPEGLHYPYIVPCSGEVYLVGGSSEATDLMPMASIAIFLLQNGHWCKVSEYEDEAFLRSTGAIYGCGASCSKIHVVTYAYDMWVAVFDCVSGVWEEPVKGNFFDMKDIFETRFCFQPNLRIAP